jgi:hypothetical protein
MQALHLLQEACSNAQTAPLLLCYGAQARLQTAGVRVLAHACIVTLLPAQNECHHCIVV